MNSELLPPARNVSKTADYYSEINNVYTEVFCESRLFGSKDLELFGKKIIFDNSKIDDKYERFWHLISFDPESEDDKYSIAPCNNLDVMQKCLKEKEDCDCKIAMPFHESLNKRVECYYRIMYLKWIDEIIELANKKDEKIETWEKKNKNKYGPGNQVKKYIRFQDINADYLIVLSDLSSVYKFITAFPISILYRKKSYTRDYKKYIKGQKK